MEEANPDVIYEGEFVASWSSLNIPVVQTVNNLEAGDVLEIQLKEIKSVQMYVYDATSTAAPGTPQLQFPTTATSIQIGITKALIDKVRNTGFSIGGTGFTITKIERVAREAFDVNSVIAYANDFVKGDYYGPETISESVNQLEVTTLTTPEWLQICDASWGNPGLTMLSATTNADGTCTRIYSLTKDDLAKLTGTFVINAAEDLLLKSIALTSSSTAIGEAEGSSAEVVKTEYFSLSGARVAEPVKGVNIVKQTLGDGSVRTSKRIVR